MDFLVGYGKNKAKSWIKQGIKKKVWRVFFPYLAPLIPVVLVFLFFSLLVLGIYGTMTSEGYMTGVEPSPQDQAIQAVYKKLASTDWKGEPAWNVNDTYLVENESYDGTPFYTSQTASGPGENQHELLDHDRTDYDLRLKWGTIHAVCLYRSYVFGEKKIPDDLPEKAAKDLHPYFYYIKRTDTYIVSSKDGTEVTTVDNYHLVEAHTIDGWYQYHYELQVRTYTAGDATVTEKVWKRTASKELWTDRYQWLKEYLKDLYKINMKDEDKEAKELELAQIYVVQAGEGFTQGQEWMNWLINNFDVQNIASGAMILTEYLPFLQEAETKYGIPVWFMAALIQVESSWNHLAVNNQTGCFGLTQQDPRYWKANWEGAGFTPPDDYRWDPRAQILAGAYLLKKFIGDTQSIDWKGEGWKTDQNLIHGLVKYGGWGSDTSGAMKSYISVMFSIAEGLKSNGDAVWPVPGYYTITSPFGPRQIGQKFHEGMDIAAPDGTQVISASSGIVTFVGNQGNAYGYYITIRDMQHIYLYGHLMTDSAVVKVGDVVKPGQPIAKVDHTGNCIPSGPDGAHLHFGVKDIPTDKYIDPRGMFLHLH